MRCASPALLAVALVLSACSSSGTGGGPAEVIRFTAEDGVELVGELRGSGPRGVVLAHMFGSDRTTWDRFAGLLADDDYLTLSFDFRGFGESEGTADAESAPLDVLAAAAEIRERGARSVVVVGASFGGTAALVAAARAEAPLDGVVTLSAPARFMSLEAPGDLVASVGEAKLFIAAQDDASAPGSAQDFYDFSTPPKRVEIVAGSDHGTALLEGPRAEVVRSLILGFLERNA